VQGAYPTESSRRRDQQSDYSGFWLRPRMMATKKLTPCRQMSK